MLHEQALAITIDKADEKADAATSPLAGTSVTYVNELGSTAAFNFGADGTLSGTYTSKVSGGGGTISGSITGWYGGYVIAWTVAWPTNPPAITSWTGEAIETSGNVSIETLWYMVTQTANPGDPSEFWTAVNAGTDTFTPQ